MHIVCNNKLTEETDAGRMNVTDAAVPGCNFGPLLGQEVVLEVTISGGALLYTVGFSKD